MRAGPYAEFHGRTYRCGGLRRPRIRLFEDASQDRPDGFDLASGEWTRLVDRLELTRLVEVRTVAVWQGRRVTVESVFDETGEALVQQWGWPPPDGPQVRVVENGCWQARIPISSLTEVVEDVIDVPL